MALQLAYHRGASASVRCLATSASLREDSLLAVGRNAYNSSEISFKHFPVEDIDFSIGANSYSKDPLPHLTIKKVVRPYGLQHATPFSYMYFPKFRAEGNLGMPFDFGGMKKGDITDPADAELSLSLSIKGLSLNEERNEDMVAYIKWNKAIHEKLAIHLATNLSAYPVLKKRFHFFQSKSPELLVEALLQATSDPCRILKDKETGTPKPDSEHLSFKQKLYAKVANISGEVKTYCPLDVEQVSRGYYRRHVPVYDFKGTEIPVPDVDLKHGDIVSVQTWLTCGVWEIGGSAGWGIRRRMRSVTILIPKVSSDEDNIIKSKRTIASNNFGDMTPQA